MNEQAVIAKGLSMVRRDNHQRVVSNMPLPQFSKQLADLVVGKCNATVVSIDLALQLLWRGGHGM